MNKLEKRRAQQRALKKARYADPVIRERVKAQQRARDARIWSIPRERARLILKFAKRRAKIYGLEFNLSLNDLLPAVLAGKCEVTGLPFDFSKSEYRTQPFAPSLDRVNSAKGYTKDNVRVVVNIHNMARNEWQAEVFNLYVIAYVETLK